MFDQIQRGKYNVLVKSYRALVPVLAVVIGVEVAHNIRRIDQRRAQEAIVKGVFYRSDLEIEAILATLPSLNLELGRVRAQREVRVLKLIDH